jgi:hypothetical protein
MVVHVISQDTQPLLHEVHHALSDSLLVLLLPLFLRHLLHLLHGHVMFIRLGDLLALAREFGLPLAFSCLRFFEAIGFMMVNFLGAGLII